MSGPAASDRGIIERVGLPQVRWLDSPLVYTVASPLLTVLGAGTTVIAPILLDPPNFMRFALMLSIFQYVTDFDMGLNRVSDRYLTRAGQDGDDLAETLLIARLGVAATIIAVACVLWFFTDNLTFITFLAGVMAMVSTGPIAVYRARSQIAAFTVSAVVSQFGMSLPRLAGLLLGGVRGCIITFLIWYGAVAGVLYTNFIGNMRPVSRQKVCALFTQAAPLFVLSSTWLLYLLANRWISWSMSSEHDAGLFAFGANLVLIGIGTVSTVSQTFYPRHLNRLNTRALARELLLLCGVTALGCLCSLVVCRYGLRGMFPHYTEAVPSTAAVILSGIPLCVNAWIVPLVIARSPTPIQDGSISFGLSLVLLYGLMRLMGSWSGINGQSLASIPPGLVLLGLFLLFVVRDRLLTRRCALLVWIANLFSTIMCVGVWYWTFG